MSETQDIFYSAARFRLTHHERKVATWLRNYAVPELSERYCAENTGLRILLDIATDSTSELFEMDGKADLIVNTLARVLGNSYRETDDYSTSYFGSLAALTFASAGNFASAKVLASRTLKNSNLGHAERWMMEILAHRHIQVSRAGMPQVMVPYAQLIDRALESGKQEDFVKAKKVFLEVNREAGNVLIPSDKGLLLLWEKVNTRFEELSVAKVLREGEFPNQAYIAKLLESHTLFYPSQVYAFEGFRLTHPTEPIFITLPTSTGKSLLGELALVASLTWKPFQRWLAVYIAPYRALTTQIMEDMRHRLRGINISCDMRQGGYLSEQPLTPGQPTIIIATPEAFDGLLRKTPDLYNGLAACVFDEFHLIEQQERGLRYEGLVGRFLNNAAGDTWPKIVALSAVVEDTAEIEHWLNTHFIVRNDWKPTARRFAIVKQNRTIEYYTPDEKLPGDSDTQVVWQGLLDTDSIDITSIALDQFRRFGPNEQILIVANTRKDTRAIARNLCYAPDLLVYPSDSLAHQKANDILRRYPYLYTLFDCLKHGVAYHNAGLPSWVRTEIERLIEKKHLRFVVSTTTLAEGVDFPFRVVILADWKGFWQFGQPQPMSRLLVKNISGRAGRAGAYIEGDTILVESSYVSQAQNLTAFSQYIRPAVYALRSSISRVLTSQSNQRNHLLADAWAVLESQFLAFLAVNQGLENVEEKFIMSLYGSFFPEATGELGRVIQDLLTDILRSPRPVLQRHSPLSLTSFGDTVLKTGLSPRSGTALANFIAAFALLEPPSEHGGKYDQYGIKSEPLITALWNNLQGENGCWIQELQGYQFRLIGSRGFPVRMQDFNDAVMAWVSGVPVELMGYMLFRGKKADVRAWLEDERAFPTYVFEEWIDKLTGFCWDYLSRQWSWVFRGAAEICRYLFDEVTAASTERLSIRYQELALEFDNLSLRLEFGVSDVESAEWLRVNCPVDRAKLDALKRWYKVSYETPTLFAPVCSFTEWLQRERSQLIDKAIIAPFYKLKILEEDLNSLEHFLNRYSDD